MRFNLLKKFFKNKKALNTAVSNLIIILAAVILSITVVFYTLNVTANAVQTEKLYIETTHVWYVNANTSIAAIGISDTGSTDIVLNKILIKGVQCQWNGTDNYIICCTINGTIPGDLPEVTSLTKTNTTINIAENPYAFTPATQGLTIKAGNSIALYIAVTDCVMVYDLENPINMLMTTTQCVYCTQTAVQAV